METIPIRHIHSTSEPQLSGSFSIRNLKEIMGNTDMIEPLHRHDFFYVLVLEQGAGSHEIDFIPYEVTGHSVFLMRPGQVHQLTLKAGSCGYLVQFRNDFFYAQHASLKELLRKVSHKKLCALEGDGFGKLIAVLENILTEYTEKREGFEEVIKSNLSIFFIELLRHRQNSEIHQVINPYAQQKLEKFLELLEHHIVESKQVSQYAEKLNLSTYQLSAITKSLLEKTPSELINEHLILESKRQLLATTNQVSQIAYQLGYEDVSYFIRFFKKQVGVSPEAFRKNLA